MAKVLRVFDGEGVVRVLGLAGGYCSLFEGELCALSPFQSVPQCWVLLLPVSMKDEIKNFL